MAARLIFFLFLAIAPAVCYDKLLYYHVTGGIFMYSLNRKFWKLTLCLSLVLTLFTGCARETTAQGELPRFKFQRRQLESVTMAAQETDFALLADCVNLKQLDLTGSTCYDQILNYISDHPNVEVVYEAPLGDLMLSNAETAVCLVDGTYALDNLTRQLRYLPGLKTLELPRVTLTSGELDTLQANYPDLDLRYTVELLGKEYDPAAAEADFEGLTSETMEKTVAAMAMLPDLTKVTLPDNLTLKEVKSLMDQFPQIEFFYTFDLFGKTLTTREERVEYLDMAIGNQGEDQIRAALDIMPNCTHFKLENCGIDNEVMASIRDDYPDTKIVWRVSFGGQYSLLTDETTLRTVYGVENSHGQYLKYCTGLKYIDMGHNTTLTDISFIEYMPDLEIVILSGSSITNVDAFANCKKLEWLELANCYALTDISALSGCESLRFLNICFSKVTDLSPIQDLPLERFLYLTPQIDKETQAAFEESHPDCWVRFTGSDPYSLGWRYNDVGVTRFEYYQKIRDIFQYDAVDRRLAQQAAQEEAEREEEEEQESGGSGNHGGFPGTGNNGGGNEGGGSSDSGSSAPSFGDLFGGLFK